MVSSNESLDSKIVRITKDLLKKEKGDFYEMVHIALEDPENEIEILDDVRLYSNLSKAINSKTPNWQAEIFSHPYMPQIALAALYHELIDIEDFVFLEAWFNAVETYGITKVKIAQLSEQLDDESVLHHYVNKQHKYSELYARKFRNIKNIYKKIATEAPKITKKNKQFAICIDITNDFEDKGLYDQLQKTGLMDFTRKNGDKLFIYPHPAFARAVHRLIFGKEAIDSSAHLGLFDADLIRKYQKLNKRLADLRFNKIKSLEYAHKLKFNAMHALVHDLFHQIAASLVFSGLRNIVEKRILPLVEELDSKFGSQSLAPNAIYNNLIDLNYRSFRNFNLSKEAMILVFFLVSLGFDGEQYKKEDEEEEMTFKDRVEFFYLPMYVAYDVAVYAKEWEKILPEINFNKIQFEKFFTFFPELIKKIKIARKNCNKTKALYKLDENVKKKYVILKAVIEYLDENITKFSKIDLKSYLQYYLLQACFSIRNDECFSDLEIASVLSDFIDSYDEIAESEKQFKVKELLCDFRLRIEDFENQLNNNTYDINTNRHTFFSDFKFFKSDVIISKQELTIASA